MLILLVFLARATGSMAAARDGDKTPAAPANIRRRAAQRCFANLSRSS